MTNRTIQGAGLLVRRFPPALLFVACTSSPLSSEPTPNSCVVPGYTRLDDFVARPTRKVDLAFIIDDSPSMGPKRDKLREQLPRFLGALKDPSDGSLPALRLAILDGDLGSGGAVVQGACGIRNGSILGDGGTLQMIGGPDCGVTDPAAHWIQTVTLSPANFSGDISQVFACLAGGLGQFGCGYQQPLEALAVSATDSGPASLPRFLREDAYLGLIIISDRDDCSALPNAAMFGPELPGETADLRCATRGHACGGQDLPYPTDTAYTDALVDCSARTDTTCAAGTDCICPTACTPLADIHALADKVKGLKRDPDNQILVAGIFGWPGNAADMFRSEYKIAPIPNPAYTPGSQAPPTLYDLWPICYDADHPPVNPDPATGYDATAAGYGAKPGLRLSAFIDEFGANGLKYSMCQPDWSRALMISGDGVKRLHNICIDQQLADADPSTPALDPDCIVEHLFPKVENAAPPSCTVCTGWPLCLQIPGSDSEWTKTILPRCDDTAPVLPCWELKTDMAKCPVTGQLVDLHMTPEPYTPAGTRLRLQCRLCPDANAGAPATPGCG
jgi:hypothetical protein